MAKSNPPESHLAAESALPRRKRSGAVTILGALLLVQSAGFLALAGLHFYWLNTALQQAPFNIPLGTVIGLRGVAFAALGILALLTAEGFFNLRSIAWLSAVATQGLSLLMAINLYYHGKPFYGYLLMLAGIVMMVYLNYSEVPKAFHVDRSARDRRSLGGV